MFGGRTIRFRSINKLHIALLLVLVFLAGYWFLPRLGSSSSPIEEKSLVRPVQNSKPVREPAIHFSPSGDRFVVEGKEKLILSGAIHYFRVVPDYWPDRLKKLKAAGLNTVETYMPWNLHEPTPGNFDFTGILDVGMFISIAASMGLHVIVRPGPYICSEWDLGGLPPWLLHDPEMELRAPYPPYLEAVDKYLTRVFEILVPLQSSYGGPIIAFQLENELAEYPQEPEISAKYMRFLYKLFRTGGIQELLFTSDGQGSVQKSLTLRPADDVLITINLMTDNGGIEDLKRLQPNKPVMIMEFWSGWFDHWNEPHLRRNQLTSELASKTAALLDSGVSLNYYMFHGGTNFGFMNGANWGYEGTSYLPTITSYDYDAPISEAGDLTPKAIEIRKVMMDKAKDSLTLPLQNHISYYAYGEVKLSLYIPILNTLQHLPEPHTAASPMAMELLPLNGCGQGYGFVLYRTLVPSKAETVSVQQLRDYGVALLDFKPVRRLNFFQSQSFVLPKEYVNQGSGQMVLDLLVENAGRVNYGSLVDSRKGIIGDVTVDGKEQGKWKIYSLEFKQSFIENIDTGGMWQRTPAPQDAGPSLFKGTLTISGTPRDTFIDMDGWEKGVVFINGVNLGRYWNVGPQRTLYVPAPVLKRGVNKVMIFEVHSQKTPQTLVFTDKPSLNSNMYT